MKTTLTLVSHQLCPYVQRAAICLIEKGTAFEREYVDLGNKPEWFKVLSPLGKVPVLKVDTGSKQTPLFESIAILEYLDDTNTPQLHPLDALKRAEHRAWIEYGSSILNDIGGLYSAPNKEAFDKKADVIKYKFQRLESELGEGRYFEGDRFSLVDAVFAPVFRYFDVFDQIGEFGIFENSPKLLSWRRALSERDSVKVAVTQDYEMLLFKFLKNKDAYLSTLMH